MDELSPTRENVPRLGLSVLSGLMLGFSFPPFPLGILACFGLVPLLVVIAGIGRARTAFRYVYIAMLVFHVITVNWTGGYAHGNDPYMMIAGAVTMLVHPFFYFIPFGIFLFIRRRLGEPLALGMLPFIWVAYEFSHSLSEWSFPWLTLGNSQTYDITRLQFITLTGVFGLSFWILLMNLVVYLFVAGLLRQKFLLRSAKTAWFLAVIALLYALPAIHGSFVLSRPEASPALQTTGSTVKVGIIQSNVDPWQKWSRSGYGTVQLYQDMTNRLIDSLGENHPDIVVWPETALPFDVLGGMNNDLLAMLRTNSARWNAGILTGFPRKVVYHDSTTTPRSARREKGTGTRFDWFNAAVFIPAGAGDVRWYGKMKMVPFAERIPYAGVFSFFDFLRWDVGIGGWQIGPDTTVFVDPHTGARFNAIICYESTYPGFVTAFVRKGAEFLTLVTIDSWWDHMSGAYQHQQISILRAIENRRWLVRCAVGGISCFIDPYGRVYDRTELFTTATLSRTIERRTDLTMYSRYGDWLGEICIWLSLVMLAAGAGQTFLTKKRAEQWQNK